MTGVLLGAFCERGVDRTTCCLELWSFPDTSINVVLNRFGPDGETEYAFPCAPHHLIGVLMNVPFLCETGESRVSITRSEEHLVAVVMAEEGVGWRQSVPIEAFAGVLYEAAPDSERLI